MRLSAAAVGARLMAIYTSRMALSLLVCASLRAMAAPLCPDSVMVRQSGSAPSSQWTVSYRAAAPALESVTFFNGPPDEEASLAYDRIVDSKDTSLATWTFPKDARGYWVKCSYRDTTLELSQALPSTISACRVAYDRQASSASGLPAIKRITCE